MPLDAGVVVCPLVTACRAAPCRACLRFFFLLLIACLLGLIAYLWQPAYGGCLEQSLAQAPRYPQLSRVMMMICDHTRGTCAGVLLRGCVCRHGVPEHVLDLLGPVQDAEGGCDDGVPHVWWHAGLVSQGVQQPRGEGGGAISGHLKIMLWYWRWSWRWWRWWR